MDSMAKGAEPMGKRGFLQYEGRYATAMLDDGPVYGTLHVRKQDRVETPFIGFHELPMGSGFEMLVGLTNEGQPVMKRYRATF